MDDMGESYRHIYYQQRLVFGEYLYDETRLEKLYKANNLNTTFLHSIYTEDYEKPVIEQCMQKMVMNGSVVPMIEKPKQDEIREKVKEWRHIFYDGERLSMYETDLERLYVQEKQVKNVKFQ